MVDASELENIIEGCKKGKPKDQKKIFDTYGGLLLSICFRYNKNEAEDILQLAFIKIFKNIHKFEGHGSFEGWLKRITVNTAITEYHKKNVLNQAEDIVDFQESSTDPGSVSALEKLSAEEIIDLINELPDIYRIAFSLYAVEGYKHNEIAYMMNISEGTSKSQISRARKMLQEKLETITKRDKETKYA